MKKPFDTLASSDVTAPLSLAITVENACGERVARARKHIRDCILMATLTSPAIAADLIDNAVRYSREAAAMTCYEGSYC